MAGFGIVLPVLGLYSERFGADALDVGLLVASYSLAQLATAPILGRLSDRLGHRSVLVGALFGFAAANLLTALAGSLTVLFVGRIVAGASAGSYTVAQATIAQLAGPDQQASLFALLARAHALGLVLGPVLGALAGALTEDAPFLVVAALACVIAVAVWDRVPVSRPAGWPSATAVEGSGGIRPGGFGGAAPRRHLLRYLATAGLAVVAFSGFEATFALLGQQRFAFTLGTASAAFAAMGSGLAVVHWVLAGPVVGRWGSERVVVWGLVGEAAGLALLAAAATPALMTLAVTLLALGHGLSTPALWTRVAAAFPHQDRGGILGTEQTSGAIARVVGPVLAGLLFDRLAPGAPYLVGAALVVVAVAVLWPVARLDGPAAGTGG